MKPDYPTAQLALQNVRRLVMRATKLPPKLKVGRLQPLQPYLPHPNGRRRRLQRRRPLRLPILPVTPLRLVLLVRLGFKVLRSKVLFKELTLTRRKSAICTSASPTSASGHAGRACYAGTRTTARPTEACSRSALLGLPADSHIGGAAFSG